MKRNLIILAVLLFAACREEAVTNNKDLEQNMMDLKIYQENLGDQLKAHHLSDASWFLEGMDSVLRIVSKRFDAHHRLNAPFSRGYEKEMAPPINGIRDAVAENDTAAALKQYRFLIKNCNNCHLDNDVDKEVKF